jgi:hypothetical protein
LEEDGGGMGLGVGGEGADGIAGGTVEGGFLEFLELGELFRLRSWIT